MTHLGNCPTMKLVQILKTVSWYDLLLCCKEEIQGILNYLVVWKLDWVASKDLLRRMGWSMIASSMRRPSPNEIPNEFYTQMNILLWNCKGALNSDFKQQIFEMLVNHYPSIMVITETRVGGDRAKKIIEGLPFDGFFCTETIGYAGGLSRKKMKWTCSCCLPWSRKFLPPSRYAALTLLGLYLPCMLAFVLWKGKSFGLFSLKWLNFITFPGFFSVTLMRHYVVMIS